MSTLRKCADVISIPKESVIRSVEDGLRPISLTTVLRKMLENFVCNWLWDHLVPSLDPYQYGCMNNSSTAHALIQLTHNWLKGIDVPGNIVRTCIMTLLKLLIA